MIDKITRTLDDYIKSKGVTPIGPLIQYTFLSSTGDENIKIALIRQADGVINEVDPPFLFCRNIRIIDCLFVRFCGRDTQLKYAYDKLNLLAFEENIPLAGHIFTVFTSMDDDNLSADVFMQKSNSEKSKSKFFDFNV